MGETMEELEWHGNIKAKDSLYNDVLAVIHNVLYYYNLTSYKPQKTNKQVISNN